MAGRGRLLHTYAAYDDLLRSETLDALVIAVPTRLHEAFALAAIERGVPVLVEKPMAPTLAEGRRLAQAAAAHSVSLMSGHIERFNPAVQELRRRLETGEGGRVLQITARRLGPFAARTRDVGVTHDLAFHDIDLMRWLIGGEVERVFAEVQTGVRTGYEDALAGTLRLRSAAGDEVVGQLEINWLTPRKVRELDVLCEQGLFVLDYLAQTLELHQTDAEGPGSGGRAWSTLANLRGREPGPVVRLPVESREPLEYELTSWLAAVREGAAVPVSSADALAALAVADALVASARQGMPVVPELP
jgi:predicted dehydrogenase